MKLRTLIKLSTLFVCIATSYNSIKLTKLEKEVHEISNKPATKEVIVTGGYYGVSPTSIQQKEVEPINIEPKEAVVEEVEAVEDNNVQEVMLEVSYYCDCEKCCDVRTGITASGTTVQEGRTVAMPKNIPFGTEVYIEELDHTYIVEDRGGYIKQLDDNTMRIDVYVSSHEKALELGRHMSKGVLYYK